MNTKHQGSSTGTPVENKPAEENPAEGTPKPAQAVPPGPAEPAKEKEEASKAA